MYLSGNEMVEAVRVSQVSGQDESLPTATLRSVTDTKQSVTGNWTDLERWRKEGRKRREREGRMLMLIQQ